jgi:hypothetical protein
VGSFGPLISAPHLALMEGPDAARLSWLAGSLHGSCVAEVDAGAPAGGTLCCTVTVSDRRHVQVRPPTTSVDVVVFVLTCVLLSLVYLTSVLDFSVHL